MLYPLNIDLTGRLVVVVGGGGVAERKVCGILAANTDVSIRLVAPKITEQLNVFADAGQIRWVRGHYVRSVLEGAFLVYAATDTHDVNALVAVDAVKIGALVNVIDDAASSSFQVPSTVRRGDLLLTVSTGGGSPAFSRMIRMELEQFYPSSFGTWLERAAVLRAEIQQRLPTSAARVSFWRNALHPNILTMVRNGELEKAEVELRHAALDIGAQSSNGSGGGA